MTHHRKIAVVGLGYVGLPVAVAFGNQHSVIGFDTNVKRIEQLQHQYDKNKEFSAEELYQAKVCYTHDAEQLSQANFFIIAVPTPINTANQPDLSLLLSASKIVAAHLKSGDIVVYESTVYPGATEEDCLPVLEKYSGLSAKHDFAVGYSPERINPGDKEHGFTSIKKVVSGQDANTLDIIAEVYASVVTAGVHKAASIKTAEAAKVIENTQRDINIALMNELAMIFNVMNIDTQAVLTAAGTKWNFLPFRPGLVGGHCIGVDPYYLTHKAIQMGHHPEIILAGRRINDDMGKYIATQIIKEMVKANTPLKNSRIAILGLTFKEDCPDLRNSKVLDIINELRSYGVSPLVHDPIADAADAWDEYEIELVSWDALKELDTVVVAVSHQEYKSLATSEFIKLLKKSQGHFIDVKSIFSQDQFANSAVNYWRL